MKKEHIRTLVLVLKCIRLIYVCSNSDADDKHIDVNERVFELAPLQYEDAMLE